MKSERLIELLTWNEARGNKIDEIKRLEATINNLDSVDYTIELLVETNSLQPDAKTRLILSHNMTPSTKTLMDLLVKCSAVLKDKVEKAEGEIAELMAPSPEPLYALSLLPDVEGPIAQTFYSVEDWQVMVNQLGPTWSILHTKDGKTKNYIR